MYYLTSRPFSHLLKSISYSLLTKLGKCGIVFFEHPLHGGAPYDKHAQQLFPGKVKREKAGRKRPADSRRHRRRVDLASVRMRLRGAGCALQLGAQLRFGARLRLRAQLRVNGRPGEVW